MPDENKDNKDSEGDQGSKEQKQEPQGSTDQTPQKDPEPNLIKVQDLGGDVVEVTSEQAYSLIQLGIESLKEKKEDTQSSKTIEEPEPETIEDKFEKLNTEFKDLKQKGEQKEAAITRMKVLDNTINKSDFLKENPEHVRHVKALILAAQVAQPGISSENAVINIVNDLQEIEKAKDERKKNKVINTDTVKNAMSGISSGGSGLSAAVKDREWKPEDVSSGEAAKALINLLESSGGT